MTNYIQLPEPGRDATHLKIKLYYDLGGQNAWTYQQDARGYYLSVTPVKIERRNGVTLESFVAFTGAKKCVKTVSRKSEKAAAQAAENAQNYIHDLALYVCNKNGLPVPAQFIYTGEY